MTLRLHLVRPSRPPPPCQSNSAAPDVPPPSSSYLIPTAADSPRCVVVPRHYFRCYPSLAVVGEDKCHSAEKQVAFFPPLFGYSVFFRLPPFRPPAVGFYLSLAALPMGSYIIHELHIVFLGGGGWLAEAECVFRLLYHRMHPTERSSTI